MPVQKKIDQQPSQAQAVLIVRRYFFFTNKLTFETKRKIGSLNGMHRNGFVTCSLNESGDKKRRGEQYKEGKRRRKK